MKSPPPTIALSNDDEERGTGQTPALLSLGGGAVTALHFDGLVRCVV